MADAIRSTPRNQPLGSLLDAYNTYVDPLLNKYQLRDVLPLRPMVDPIIGGTTLGDFGPNQIRDIATEMSYGNYQPFRNTRNIQTATLDPTTFDALTMLPFGAGAAKAAKPVAQAAGRTAAKAAVNKMVDLEQKYGLPTSPMMSVVKPEGGQWESTGVERLGRNLKNMSDNKDVSNWLQTTGRKYIMNRSGTPKDEIRLLADQGITHLSPAELRGGFEQTDRMLMGDVIKDRKKAGFPDVGMAETDLGRRWELRADAMIQPNKAEDFLYSDAAKADMPWLEKIDPQTPVYGHMLSDTPKYLGMDKIANALSNEIEAGRLRPDQLNKVSMGQAVKLADEQRLASEAAQAEILQTIPTVREYPEGFAWKELTNEDPEMLDAILKREGEIMQNCVGDGGYCDDVLEAGTRLFSLRDAAGNPHVTIEVRNPRGRVEKQLIDAGEAPESIRALSNDELLDVYEQNFPNSAAVFRAAYGDEYMKPAIKQVKGKQNEAPIEDYIPYVQDFVMNPVTGSPFNKVGDLANTGLIDLERLRKHGLFDLYASGSGRNIDKELRRIYPPMTGPLGGEMLSGEFGVRVPSYDLMKRVVGDMPGNYASPTNLVDYLKTIEPRPIEQGFSNFTPGFAAGGLVGMDGIDPDEFYEFIDRGQEVKGFAEGGGFVDKAARIGRKGQYMLADIVGLRPEVQYATETPERYFPANEQHNSRGDAMRHILFQAELMRKYGETPAKIIGFMHENLSGPQGDAEKAMDVYNDRLGRQIGRIAKDRTDLERLALEAIERRQAKILSKDEMSQGYAQGGLVYNDYDEMYEFR